MKDHDVAIDTGEIREVLCKGLDALAAGLIDKQTANKLSAAAKRANSIIRASLKGATPIQRGELASVVAELRDTDRMLTGVLERRIDATIASDDLNASND